MPRWRATVSARARSRLALLRPAVFSSSPVACWKRRPNSSRRAGFTLSRRSAPPISPVFCALLTSLLCSHELGADGQLVAGEAHRLARQLLVHAGELEHDAARLHDGDPALGRALAGAHAGLGRLLRERLVRIDVDPDLAATLDLAGHRDSGSLDLAVGEPTGVEGLDAVLAELHPGLATGKTRPPATGLPAMLDALGAQHLAAPPSARPAAAATAAAEAAAATAAAAAATASAATARPTGTAGATRSAAAATAAAPATVATVTATAAAIVVALGRRSVEVGEVGAGVALGH